MDVTSAPTRGGQGEPVAPGGATNAWSFIPKFARSRVTFTRSSNIRGHDDP